MLDTRINSIIYQSQIYYSNLINELVAKKAFGKSLDSKWEKADLILGYLEALTYRDRLVDDNDISDLTYILECLIKLCDIYTFPVGTPLNADPVPNILYGIPGRQGDKGDKGDKGDTGLATDFLAGPSSIPVLVDSFLINDAKAARWDYVVSEAGGARRAGSIIGHWNGSGTEVSLSGDFADDDTGGSTDGIEFDVQATSSNIFFVANITSGTWVIQGSRYFIPNNGNGTGPISGVLSPGKIYIGNDFGLAEEQYVSGAITLLSNGLTSINNGVITDIHISNSAAISLSKLATLPANRIVLTDNSGVLTTTTSPTTTELSRLSGVTSNVQIQLNQKITDPTTTVGDIIIRNSLNNIARLGAGSNGQILTISGGIPIWQNAPAGFADPMTTIGDVIIRNGTNTTTRLGIGTAGQVLTVFGGIPAWRNPAVIGVTSIAATAPAAGFTISGSPITTSGTLTFSLSDDLAGLEALSTTGVVRRTAPNVYTAGTVPISEGGTNITTYTTGDILYSSASNVLSKLPIGSNGQVLTINAGIPKWSSGYISGSLVAGRVTLSSGTTTVTDDPDFTFNASGNVLTLTSGEITGGVTSLLLTTQSGNQPITLRPNGTGAFNSESRFLNIGSNSVAGNAIISVKSSSTNEDLVLNPKQSGSASGYPGTGTVLMPSVGIGVGQPFRVDGGGYVNSPGYYALYHPSSGPDIAVYTAEKVIELGGLNMSTGFGSNFYSHGLNMSKILSVSVSVINDAATTIRTYTESNNIGSSVVGAVAVIGNNIAFHYNTTNFSDCVSTSINRGRIYIKYISAGI